VQAVGHIELRNRQQAGLACFETDDDFVAAVQFRLWVYLGQIAGG